MSDLFGNHIDGFPTRRLIYTCHTCNCTPICFFLLHVSFIFAVYLILHDYNREAQLALLRKEEYKCANDLSIIIFKII